ncbi:hypothetical protein Bca4012_075649 [Brassica carinata]
MVRATELSLPAKRKTPPLVSICPKRVERVTKVAQNQEIIKSLEFFFSFYSCDLCDHYDSPCWAEGEAIFRHVICYL